jgi:Stage II sporulation protein E (SpoIIE)
LRTRYRVQPLPLEVGDRLMFVTDGMLERDAARMNIAAVLTASVNMHPREAVQHLTQAVRGAVHAPSPVAATDDRDQLARPLKVVGGDKLGQRLLRRRARSCRHPRLLLSALPRPPTPIRADERVCLAVAHRPVAVDTAPV